MMEMPIVEALEHVAAIQTLDHLCENNQHELIIALLQSNKSLKEFLSVLFLQSFPNCLECVDIFINNLPSEAIEKPGSLGRNALIAGIVLGENNFPVIQRLVEYKEGILVNAPDSLGRTAVHYAVIKGDVKIVKLLVEQGGANANHIDDEGNCILHQFFKFNVKSSEMLHYLLHGKPNQQLMMHQGKESPMMYAMKINSPYLMQLSRNTTDDVVVRHPTVERRRMALEYSLYDIQDGDLDELKDVVERFGDSVDGNGDTILHSLIKFGLTNQAMIDYCLKEPGVLSYQINAQNRSGKTPLYMLLEKEKPLDAMFNAIMQSSNLDLSIVDNTGWTFLKPALKQKEEVFLRIYAADPSQLFRLNFNGLNVFIYMISQNVSQDKKMFDLIKILTEEYELDLTVVDDLSRNVLHVCGEFGRQLPYIYDYIFNKLPVDPQTMVNARDHNGYTPLMSALKSKNYYIFNHLFKKFEIDLHIRPNPGFNENYFTIAIEHGTHDIQLEILRRCPELARYVNDLGITPVMVCIRRNKLELMKILIEEYHVDINVKNNYGDTLLHYLAIHNVKDVEFIDLLLNGNRNISFYINERNEDNLTAYDMAIKKDNIELANAFAKFLTTEADIAQIDVQDVTNEKPATMTSKNLDYFSLYRADSFWDDLRVAIEKNDIELVKKNIIRSSDDILTDWDNGTALHFMSTIENIGPNIIDYLLNECNVTQKYINAQNKYGETPLHCAAVRGHIPLLNALLKHIDIHTNVQNKKGETAFLAAINNDWVKYSEDVIRMLLIHNPALVRIPDYHGITPLQASILHNHFEVLKLLVEKGKANVHYVDDDGDTLAHFLAGYKEQDPKVIEYLMNKPNNILKHINKLNKSGNTPLHAACKTNNEKYVLYLLNQRRIDLLRVNHMNETPLFVCLSVNRKSASSKIIEGLVTKWPAMVNKPNFVGDLPILLSINVENHDAVKVLLEHGKIDVNFWLDKQNNTLLHYLFLYNTQDRSIIKLLIDKGQSVVNLQNNLGDTVLHFACRDHQLDVLHILIQCPDVDLTVKNSYGNTPLMELLKPGNDTFETSILVKTMVNLFPSLKYQKNNNGLTPIHKAIQNGLFDCAKYLLPTDNSTSIQHNFTDNAGNNLFHYLARYVTSDEKLIVLYLKGMSHPEIDKIVETAINNDGKTPLELAHEYKNDIFLNVIETS